MDRRLAIEIGGTKLQAALGDASGKILRLERCAVPSGVNAATIRDLLAELAGKLTGGQDVERVGIGFGGPVDAESGRVVRSFHVPGWDGFRLRDWAEERLGLPCVIENDTNCGALAEARLGAGAGASVVFYPNIGTGIGGGIVIEGELYSRPLGAAEIGHMKLWDSESGGYVIVETLCSGRSLGRMAQQRAAAGAMPRVLELAGGNARNVTAEHVGRAAAEADPPAAELVAAAADNFAVALCNVIALINPDRIVVGGGVSLMGEAFFEPLREAVARRVFPPYAKRYEIVPAGLGENVVVVGALLI